LRQHLSRHPRGAVPNPHVDPERGVESLEGDEVDTLRDEPRRLEGRRPPDEHGVPGGVESDHVPRLAVPRPESLALADGVRPEPGVDTHLPPPFVEDRARPKRLCRPLPQKLPVVALANAKFLALRRPRG